MEVAGITSTQWVLVMVCSLIATSQACDKQGSESVATQLREIYETAYRLFVNTGTVTSSVPTLCLGTLQTLGIHTKFKAGLAGCAEEDVRDVQLHWNSTQIVIINFCREVCPNYSNVLKCVQGIEVEATQSYEFERFCGSFNTSRQCAIKVLGECPFDPIDFFYGLVKPYSKSLWNNMCNSGCSNLDVSVGVIVNDCWSHVASLASARVMDEKCRHFVDLHQCLENNTEKCPQTESLLTFQYPPYRSIGKLCLATTASMPTSQEQTTEAPGDVRELTTAEITPTEEPTTTVKHIVTATNQATTIPSTEKGYSVKMSENPHGEERHVGVEPDNNGAVGSKPVQVNASYYPTEILYYSMAALVVSCLALTGVICLICVHIKNRHHRTWHTGEPRSDIETDATKEPTITEEN
ncbi:hypothetical protein ScPMuIL_006730 [Solemya velum]